MLMTLIPMYKITKASILFFVGFCLVSYFPTSDVSERPYFKKIKTSDLDAFYGDVLHKATDLFSNPNSTPSLEVQNNHKFDSTRLSGDGVNEQDLAMQNAAEDFSGPGPGNSTLGFSSITALTSRSSTWRFEGLVQAAKLTNLSIQALPELERTPADIERFNSSHKAYISRGALQAWMSHVRALEEFLASNDSTTLILEDDVDWDVNIKPQMQKLSMALQAHYSSNPEQYPKDSQASPDFPYGYESWDVLWLGHCGGAVQDEPGRPGNATLPYHDPSLLDLDSLITSENRPPMDPFFRYIQLPAAKPSPICSFAYAVTRQSAERILEEMKREGLSEDAFDIRLFVLCRWTELKCLSVFPELFHHQQWNGKGGGSLIKAVDEGFQKTDSTGGGDGQHVAATEGESERQPAGQNGDDSEPQRWTENIKYSARCNSEPASTSQSPSPKVERSMRIRRRSATASSATRMERKWKMCLPWHRLKKAE